MEYMTVKDAAQRWNVTERLVQRLCAEGRVDGAVKFGRSWSIPVSARKPDDSRRADSAPQAAMPRPRRVPGSHANLMPLMNTPFAPGTCAEFVDSLAPGPRRDIARAELCYFSGRPEEAVTAAPSRRHREGLHSSAPRRRSSPRPRACFCICLRPRDCLMRRTCCRPGCGRSRDANGHFSGWTQSGAAVGSFDDPSAAQITFTMPAGAVELTANYDAHSLAHHDGQDPTCTDPGWAAYDECACGYSTYQEIPAAGHSFVDGVCTVCGEKESSQDPDQTTPVNPERPAEPSELGSSEGLEQDAAAIPATGDMSMLAVAAAAVVGAAVLAGGLLARRHRS